MEAEPSHLAGSMSLAPNTSVTDCHSSAEGAGWGLVIWAWVEDCRRNSSPAAPVTQSVSKKDRFIETGPRRITIQDRAAKGKSKVIGHHRSAISDNEEAGLCPSNQAFASNSFNHRKQRAHPGGTGHAADRGIYCWRTFAGNPGRREFSGPWCCCGWTPRTPAAPLNIQSHNRDMLSLCAGHYSSLPP